MLCVFFHPISYLVTWGERKKQPFPFSIPPVFVFIRIPLFSFDRDGEIMTGCTHVEVAVARGIERGCAADRKEGERNLIGKVVSSGDGGGGCGESPKVEDGNQSRLKWIERERGG
jgi:hypothetical protein